MFPFQICWMQGKSLAWWVSAAVASSTMRFPSKGPGSPWRATTCNEAVLCPLFAAASDWKRLFKVSLCRGNPGQINSNAVRSHLYTQIRNMQQISTARTPTHRADTHVQISCDKANNLAQCSGEYGMESLSVGLGREKKLGSRSPLQWALFSASNESL